MSGNNHHWYSSFFAYRFHVVAMAKLTTEEFIVRAKAVHGDKYDYSKVEYVNSGNHGTVL